MGKKIIFIDSRKTRTIRYMTGYNYGDCSFYIDYWDTKKTFIDKTRLYYPVEYTVIFSMYDSGDIHVRSEKCIAQNNLRIKAMEHSSEGLLYPHISEAFKIFDDINANAQGEGKDPVWMLEFDLDDTHMSAVLRVALNHLFHSFTLSEPACDTVITKLYRDYHPETLYNMMVKNLTKKDHDDMLDSELFALLKEKKEPQTIYKLQQLDRDDIIKEEGKAHYDKMFITACRGNGKTALAQRIMRDYIYGIKTGGKSNMRNTVINFRKDLEYFRRSSANTNCWEFKLKNTCEGYHQIYKIEIQGAGRKLKPADSTKEDLMIIAEQMVHDGFSKVIFNPKEKLTIIFPESFWMRKDYYSEKYVVKAHGDDQWDMIKGYSIAKAKAYSNDGYDWMNKLLRSGKVKW